MSLDRVPAGKEVPNDCNVVIEIPMRADPIKYEVDKETGAVFVDRFMSTAMHYPCNYGYVPQTLSDDGDPCDVLVLSPMPLVTGVVVRCRPIGMLKLDDEAGGDAKILAVPIDKLSSLYHHVKSPRDLPEITTRQIAHFFEHYKDLEPGKWVRVGIWVEAEEAKREIVDSIARFQRAQREAPKPAAAPKAGARVKVESKGKAKAKAKGKGKGKRKSADGGKTKAGGKTKGRH
jgi:inorganic pyrophosphatase